MKVVLGCDHAGFTYKTILITMLKEAGHEITDVGAYSEASTDDYPDFAELVAKTLMEGRAERGILICGSAVGVNVAVNKFRGIRAGICHDTYSAHQSVEHDDANVLCLGERVIGIEVAKEVVTAFLNARFTGEPRHKRRLAKIAAIEERNMK